MALSISIRFNEKDVRETFGLEILNISDIGSPRLRPNTFNVAGRHGGLPDTSSYTPRPIRISGYIEATSHANLLSQIDDMKKFLGAEIHGLRTFRISLEDMSDRYFIARLTNLKIEPIHPRFTSLTANVEITVVVDNPFGIYNIYTFENVAGSPFAQPYSMAYNYSGTAICRPRIMIKNNSENAVTNLKIINTAVRYKNKNIAVTTTNIPRIEGRWGDYNGAGLFDSGNSPTFNFAAQGNFNAGTFTIFMFVYCSAAPFNPGYLFSTTGDVVKLYYDDANDKFVFDVNGLDVVLLDSATGFANGTWWGIAASYGSPSIRLKMYNTSTGIAYDNSSTIFTPYRGMPTNVYIGSDAAGANVGSKYLDDIRLYNHVLEGMSAFPAEGAYIEQLLKMSAPLPVEKGSTFYCPFDYKANGIGLENTELNIATSLPTNSLFNIDCDKQNVKSLTADFQATGTDVMADVTGEFPFLIPGWNGIQVFHDGASSNINMVIEDKRRFL